MVERQLISEDELERVTKLRDEQQAPLTRLVVELGIISEEDLLPVLHDHFDIPVMSLRDLPNTPLPIDLPTGAGDFFKLARMVPVSIDGRSLLVATTDPLDVSRLHALELAIGLPVKPVLAKEKEIAARIEALYGSTEVAANGQEFAEHVEGIGDQEEDVAHLRDMASEVPVIRMVNQMLIRALESRASDVHIEPFEEHLKIRYRIDGILHEGESPPRHLKAAVISRLKILAQLNIAERRLPQDGRIKTRLGGKDIDLRISTVPTLYGESVVIRLLERGQIFAQLDTLGFPPEPVVVLQRDDSKVPRYDPGYRPDGERQDDHALRRAAENQRSRKKNYHHRRPGRIPTRRCQSDSCQAADRPHLRQRSSFDRAPRPRCDHGR